MTRASCLLCRSGAVENVEHFLLDCAALRPCRERLQREVRDIVSMVGVAEGALLTCMSASRQDRLRCLLGGAALAENYHEDRKAREQCGQALWMHDKAVKNYLLACWRLRESVMGPIRVVGGRLVRSPPEEKSSRAVLSSQGQRPAVKPALDKSQEFWTPWIPSTPGLSHVWRRSGKRGRANFYVVFRGRETGIFYKWSDCMRAVAGYEGGGEFRGYERLDAAESAFSAFLGS